MDHFNITFTINIRSLVLIRSFVLRLDCILADQILIEKWWRILAKTGSNKNHWEKSSKHIIYYIYISKIHRNIHIFPFPQQIPLFSVISFQGSVVHKWRLQLWRQFLQAPYREAGSDTAWNIPAIGREVPSLETNISHLGKRKTEKIIIFKSARLVGNMLVLRRVCCGDVADESMNPPTRVGVTGKYLMQNPNGVDRS